MDLIEKIKQEFTAFEEKRKELAKQLRKEFPEIIKPLLEKSTTIDKISWNQYTPYFNDGDECIFSANVEDFRINDNEDSMGDIWWRNYPDDTISYYPYIRRILKNENEVKENAEINTKRGGYSRYNDLQIGEEGYVYNPDYNSEEGEIINGLKEILTSIPDEFYQELFGNHVEVTIYKNGNVEVNEYDHD
jgi:hypothetical protein